jgi:hypothetical protein
MEPPACNHKLSARWRNPYPDEHTPDRQKEVIE